MRHKMICLGFAAALLLPLAVPAAASGHSNQRSSKIVAYDAKDNKYYSVAWAKAHGMHDRGGDLLTIRRFSSLPKTAKMSRAMHGKM